MSSTIDEYVKALPEDRKGPMETLIATLDENLPKGFSKEMTYGMPGFVVPHSMYPDGYHVDKTKPLPFISVASRKGNIAMYHMGLYADPELLAWFKEAYPKHSKTKLDMGKSCVRIKKVDQIPLDLIGELARKVGPKDWINVYEREVRR